MATSDSGSLWIRVWWTERVERSTHVSKRRFVLEIFSLLRGTHRESDTASRCEEACLLNLCNVVAQWSHQQPGTENMTLLLCVTFISYTDVLGPSRIAEKTILIIVHSALAPVLCCFPLLQMQWLVVSTLCQETKKHRHQKVESEGKQKIGPVLEVATCCLLGKYGVEIRIMSISLLGQNFSWLEQVCHEFEQQ